MRTEINKSVKRVLSLALAFIMLVGTLFTANVGVSISADAAELNVVYVQSGINQTAPTRGTGTQTDPYIIENPSHIRYIAQKSTPATTYGKYYKVDPTIDIMVFQTESYIKSVAGSLDAFLALDAAGTKTALSNTSGRIQYQSGSSGSSASSYDSFAGTIDFSGVTICGMYNKNGGLIAIANGGATLKNLTLCNNYIESGWYNGNLVGYIHHGSAATTETIDNGDSTTTTRNIYKPLTIENIEIHDCYQTTTGTGYANTGVLAGTGVNSTRIPYYISNILTYDNISLGTVSGSDATQKNCALFGTLPAGWNGSGDNVQNASYSNIVTLDCVPYPTASINNQCTRATFYSSVYTTNVIDAAPNVWDTNWADFDITVLSSADLALDLAAATNMKKLNWATSETNVSDGDSYWFVRKNNYPTPVKPNDEYWKNLVIIKTWSGGSAGGYAGGTGTQEDPYIIKTAEQLYRALSTITDTTNNVAGGYQGSTMLKQGSTTEYVPVYTPYYYKVADGVDALYLNDIVGSESLSGIKALVSGGTAINWAPGKSFVGDLDGNGVTIYGMYCSSGTGLVKKLDGSAIIKNFNFDSCYTTGSGNVSIVTTELGSYSNDSTLETIANISVRNSYLNSTRDLALVVNTSNNLYQYSPGPALVSSSSTCENLTIINCLYDGYSCERTIKSTSGEITEAMIGGIISGGHGMNNTTVSGSISLKAPVVDEVYCAGKEVFYNRYTKSNHFQVYFYDNYTDKTQQITAAYPGLYDKLDDIVRISYKDTFAENDFPLLQWGKQWQIKTFGSRSVPMPMGEYTGGGDSVVYNNTIALSVDGVGAVKNNGVIGNYGKYGWEHKLNGTGTPEDPFLITTALELARVIGSGGKHSHYPFNYKLTCDIDLSGSTWINQASVDNTYVYVPFEGTIDGAGHTITGLTCIDATGAGFIPHLNGGTVKNLRFVDCYAGSTNAAGIIAGQVSGGTITNCSVENSIAYAATTSTLIGNWDAANVTNCVLILEGADPVYVLDTANAKVTASAVTDIYSKNNTDALWYKGLDGIIRLTTFAKGRTVTDVDGDGVINDGYEPNDLIALRKCLLGDEDFVNIYSDISGNGVVNLSDLAIMRRSIAGDYNKIGDGFWRNVEIGAVEVYYDENDNYDFARKVQIYLESLYKGLGVKKYTADTVVAGTEAGTPSGQAYVYVKTDTSLSYDQYKIDFDSANLIVTISGGSFTAVEEAVNEFVNNCDNTKANAGVYTTTTKSIDTTVKGKKWIDIDLDGVIDSNEYLYYAWGDEFNDEKQTGSVDTYTWDVRNYKYEGTSSADGKTAAEVDSTRYLNLESPVIENIPDLWEVKDGKLTIWRGVNASAWNDAYAWGYKPVNQPAAGETNDFGRPIDAEDIYVDPGIIQTSKSMLFKQGYSEMRAALPSDGHAFPAWWFYNGTQETSNINATHRTLFNKVYSLNNGDINPITGKVNNPNESTRWDGTNNVDQTNLATYKYQVPQAYLEFDIVEFMQAGRGTQYTQSTSTKRVGVTTGDWRDFIQLTIHKYYDQHAKDGKLYIPDWSTGDFLAGSNSSGTAWKGMTQATFVNTAGSSAYIHRFDPDTTTSKYPYTEITGSWFWTDETTTSASYSVEKAIAAQALTSGKTVTDVYNYGFYWTVSGSTYDLIVYVDFDDDGNMSASEMVFHIDENVGHEYDDPTWGNTSASKGSDAHVWNQYAYMLLDNAFYTSNPYGTSTRANTLTTNWSSEAGVTPYSDLLTQQTGHGTGGAKDKTTFDVEYVRVYQEDGKRDIVTNDTENFNTNNHFGY